MDTKLKLAMGVKAAAEAIDVSPRTIENYICQGELASLKVGRRRLVRVKDLERFIGSDRSSPRMRETG
jgi:excisionase family DNA binding protein